MYGDRNVRMSSGTSLPQKTTPTQNLAKFLPHSLLVAIVSEKSCVSFFHAVSIAFDQSNVFHTARFCSPPHFCFRHPQSPGGKKNGNSKAKVVCGDWGLEPFDRCFDMFWPCISLRMDSTMIFCARGAGTAMRATPKPTYISLPFATRQPTYCRTYACIDSFHMNKHIDLRTENWTS